jgi:ketopantoate hydroxymethyltransferase
MKQRGDRIVMLTAYDATMARLLDRAGIDLRIAIMAGIRTRFSVVADQAAEEED